jgi:putative toxin-antitoxin system antitoxin component (TIGR02293 family)
MAEPVLSEQLRRTLSFFEGTTAHWGEATTAIAASAKAIVAASRKKQRFTVVTWSGQTPLLQPRAIELLAGKLHIEESILLDVSCISQRTFHRRQEQDKPLTATETDRVLRIARVASEAARVFGDEEKARRWLSKENRMLGAKPLELLATDAGSREVEAELIRIDWGDFA